MGEHFNNGINISSNGMIDWMEKMGMPLNSVTYDPDTWVSETKYNTVIIGTAPIPESVKRRIMPFETERIDLGGEVLHKTAHEFNHHYVPREQDANPNVQSLFAVLQDIRNRNDGYGVSGLGSLEFYKVQGLEFQAREDLIELYAMYTVDPKYFLRYMDWLTKRDPKKKEAKVCTIDRELASFISHVVTDTGKRM